MQTRSQTQNQKRQIYEVNIDFDEASQMWKANKKSIGNGSYKYICLKKTKTGKPCKREAMHNCDYCNMHRLLYTDEHLKWDNPP